MKSFKLLAIASMVALVGLTSCGDKAQKAEEANVEAVDAADMAETGVLKTGVITVTDNNIDVPAATPYIIDFNASWCGPCKAFHPTFVAAAEKYAGKLTFLSVDIDENGDLAEMYNVEAVPTLIGVNADGNTVKTVGMLDEQSLELFIEDILR